MYACDVTLQVVHVGVHHAVEAHLRRPALRVVEEVQGVRTTGHVGNQLPVQHVVGRSGHAILRNHLLGTQPVVVVLELHGHSGPAHLAELPASAPGVAPGAVAQRVTNGIVSNGLAVVRRQLVLPVAVTVGVRNRLQRRAQRAGGTRDNSAMTIYNEQDYAIQTVSLDLQNCLEDVNCQYLLLSFQN